MIKTDPTTASWILKISSFVMSIAIMISSWFLSQAWDKINTIEKSVHELEITAALTNSTKFTNNDWASAKSVLDADRLAMDRRIIRLEESLPSIKDSLIEIKNSIQREK
jgi:hypothetical protein